MDYKLQEGMIIVESKGKKLATILKKYPEAILADVTGGAKDGLYRQLPEMTVGQLSSDF